MTYLEQLDHKVAQRIHAEKVSDATRELVAAIQKKLPGNVRLESGGIGNPAYRLAKNDGYRRDNEGPKYVVRESVVVDLFALADELGVEVPGILR